MTGTTNRKIIVVPCIVNSSLYVCGVSRSLLGTASCRRISRASTPPRMKKPNVRTRYMIPIRLWSVVATHDVQPVAGASTLRAATCGIGVRVVVGASTVAAMRVVRSSGLRLRVSGVGRVVRRGGGLPRRGRTGRLAVGGGALELLALRGALDLGGLDVGLATGEPALVLLDGDGPHARGHVGVVAAAELGALAEEEGAARLGAELAGDLEPRVVRVAGDGVELAAELGDPPGVRDVLRVDVERHGRVDGDDELGVGERRAERRVGAVGGVGVAPDVLLAVHADVQRLAVGRQATGGARGHEHAVGQLEAPGTRVGRVADAAELGEREGGEHDED